MRRGTPAWAKAVRSMRTFHSKCLVQPQPTTAKLPARMEVTGPTANLQGLHLPAYPQHRHDAPMGCGPVPDLRCPAGRARRWSFVKEDLLSYDDKCFVYPLTGRPPDRIAIHIPSRGIRSRWAQRRTSSLFLGQAKLRPWARLHRIIAALCAAKWV
jgi:hypothetical protein